MITKRLLRIGGLVLAAVLALSSWSLVLAAQDQLATLAVNPTGSIIKPGMALIGGTVDCAQIGSLSINGTITQPVSRRYSVTGSFARMVNCAPGSPAVWTAQVVPVSGKFAGGLAIVTGSYNGSFQVRVPNYVPYPPYPNCYYSYWDYTTGEYVYQCYVSGSFGPQVVRLSRR